MGIPSNEDRRNGKESASAVVKRKTVRHEKISRSSVNGHENLSASRSALRFRENSKEVRTVLTTSISPETLFRAYYEMGPDRNLLDLCEAAQESLEVIQDIYDRDGWSVKIRDLEDIQEKEFENQFKVKSRKIREAITHQLDTLLEGLQNSAMGLPLSITSVADLKTVSSAYAELVRATQIVLQPSKRLEDETKTSSWSDLLTHAEDESGFKGG